MQRHRRVVLFALGLLLLALAVSPAVSAQNIHCAQCTQICWGLWGCEYFCVEATGGGGWERCYSYPDYCGVYGRCWVYTA